MTVAKAYRLLRTICETALSDELIARNPCNIRGAAVEHSPERPVLSVAEVEALAATIEERYRALVLLGAWCGLRLGEALALDPSRCRPGGRVDQDRQVRCGAQERRACRGAAEDEGRHPQGVRPTARDPRRAPSSRSIQRVGARRSGVHRHTRTAGPAWLPLYGMDPGDHGARE